MKERKYNWQMGLMVCVLVVVIINLLMILQLSADMQEMQKHTPNRRSLPCGAIPTRYVIDEPECADKLLRSMNVTNVRILPRNVTYPPGVEQYIMRLRNVSFK